jgi:hypothetical protein
VQHLKDFGRFCLWFFGLGYTVFVFTQDAAWLPPLFQLAGILAAVATLVHLLLIAVRYRRGPGKGDRPKPTFRRRRPEKTVMRVKARDHFGLRGVDR